MKKIAIAALTVVLTVFVFTGCRNNSKPMETTRPTTMPTTQATTAPTTQATQPSTAATQPSETVDHGNGPMDATDGTVDPANGADGTVGDNGTESTGSGSQSRISPMPRNR